MIMNISLLRPCRNKLYYCWHQQAYFNRTFSSFQRAPNVKGIKKLCNINKGCINQNTFYSFLMSNRRRIKLFQKHNSKILKFARIRFYSLKNDNEEPSKFLLVNSLSLLCLILPESLQLMTTVITWDDFVNDLLSKGEIEKLIAVDNHKIHIILKKDAAVRDQRLFERRFVLHVSDLKSFEDDLREVEDSLGIKPSDRILLVPVQRRDDLLTKFLLFHMIWTLLYKRSNIQKFNPFSRMTRAKFTLIDPFTGGTKGVKFSDVAGLKEAKQEIMEFVDYLKRPEHYQDLGAKVPKGALLLGPPGCGKTLLAKAVASEANVPFLSMNGSEFIEMIGGLGAARVRDLFAEAKKISPCIIYIDEIDAIGRNRAESGSLDASFSEAEHTLNQLLVEMDGMASTKGVVTLASTNRADVLDKALLRPGRFDRHIMIDLPNAEERREIFLQYLKRIRLQKQPEYYTKRMASLTPGFSGADIANICNEAALHAARFKKDVVTGEDLEYAIDRVVGGTERRSSAIAPEEKELVAYHEAGRVLVGWLSDRGEILVKMSVVPRTHQSVGWTQFSQPEQYLFSQEELFDKMCMALGGRAAESIVFNKMSTKSENDLRKVTRIAYAQISQYGMNRILGPISFGEMDQFQRKPYSRQLGFLIDEEARKLVGKAYEQADTILRDNFNLLVKLAQELLKRESMTYTEVEALIGPPKNVNKKMVEPLVFDLSIDKAASSSPFATN